MKKRRIITFITILFFMSLQFQSVNCSLAHLMHDAGQSMIDYVKSIGTTISQEVRAFSHVRVMFPGLITDELIPINRKGLQIYVVGRLRHSGVSLGLALSASIVFCLLFEHLAKTNSRGRSKKMMVAALCGAALYGSQLRQRRGFGDKTVLERAVINRLLLLFGAVTATTLFTDVLVNWFKGDNAAKTRFKECSAWSLEVAFFTAFAAAFAFTLDSPQH